MGWADGHIARLAEGKTVQFRPPGHSMTGKISSGQRCTVEPVGEHQLVVDDIVLCRVKGAQYLHLIKASPTRYVGADLMLEDGDLAMEDGDFAMIRGAAAIGQYIGLGLSEYFADLSDPERFSERVGLQGVPRPEGARHAGTYASRHEE